MMIILSMFFLGLWTLATALANNIEQMMLFRFLTGLGLGAAMPNVGTLVAEYAPERRRVFIITVVFCGFTFGAASGGFAASSLLPLYNWHAVMLMGVFYGMGLFLVYLIGSWLPSLINTLGMSVTEAAIITAMYPAGGTLGSLLACWLMDRFNANLALMAIYFCGELAIIALGFSTAEAGIMSGIAFCSGFCFNGSNTGMNALSASYYPTHARATGSSWRGRHAYALLPSNVRHVPAGSAAVRHADGAGTAG